MMVVRDMISTSSSLQHTTIQTPETEILRVNEIFLSLQGETSRVGLPTVFVRLTGCPLRCGYCDTEYAFYNGESISISSVLDAVSGYGVQNVTVTGGEPLAQKKCLLLLRLLCDAGYSVSLETSGALDVSKVDVRVIKVLDVKTPGSGEDQKNNWTNLDYLTSQDELKFVLCDEADYQWAVKTIRDYHLDKICPILFSPVYSKLDPALLAAWVLRDRLGIRVQIQLHKLLWGEEPGR
jgi:7-carboxy-7-deazaguanine synthase